jgi:hypothetical protein
MTKPKQAAAKRSRASKPLRRSRNWRRVFLDTLAETSNIRESAARARITASHVYATRKSDPEFAREWQVALAHGYDMLEMTLLQRMRGGEDAGETTIQRKFDNATGFRLLAAHRASTEIHKANVSHEDSKAVRASIDAKLEDMRQRVLAARKALDDAG